MVVSVLPGAGGLCVLSRVTRLSDQVTANSDHSCECVGGSEDEE